MKQFTVFTLVFVLMLCLMAGCTFVAGTSNTSPETNYRPTGQRDDPSGTPSPEATGTHVPAETTGRISEEAAWQIALEHAGLTRDQVTGTHIEFEIDDGRPEYNVEFHQGYLEYDYEIHAETGKILSYDRD